MAAHRIRLVAHRYTPRRWQERRDRCALRRRPLWALAGTPAPDPRGRSRPTTATPIRATDARTGPTCMTARPRLVRGTGHTLHSDRGAPALDHRRCSTNRSTARRSRSERREAAPSPSFARSSGEATAFARLLESGKSAVPRVDFPCFLVVGPFYRGPDPRSHEWPSANLAQEDLGAARSRPGSTRYACRSYPPICRRRRARQCCSYRQSRAGRHPWRRRLRPGGPTRQRRCSRSPS